VNPILTLDGIPPVVAAYTMRGARRHTVILPFVLPLARAFRPKAQDMTIYDAGWRDAKRFWGDITPTNRLIAAYYTWPKLTELEKVEARPSLQEALEQALGWAEEVGLPASIAPWEL
jgi:hypothetical protein